MKQLLLFIVLLIAGQTQATIITGHVDGIGASPQGLWVLDGGLSAMVDSSGDYIIYSVGQGPNVITMKPEAGWTFSPSSQTRYIHLGDTLITANTITATYTPPAHHKKKKQWYACTISDIGGGPYWLLQGMLWALVGLIGYRQTRRP